MVGIRRSQGRGRQVH